jgi:DNA-binding NarL/FixJ family response regulator
VSEQDDATDQPIRVLLVDDHEALAASLAYRLGRETDMVDVGLAGTLTEARELIPEVEPDVVLLDHHLPDGDGVAAIVELRSLRPSMRFVVLTASESDDVLVAAMEAGASGFVSKTRGLADITTAVRAAAAGESVVTNEQLSRLLPRMARRRAQDLPSLTAREQQVLELIADGLTNDAIAERLVVSRNTVRNHVANLSGKLGAHSKLEVLAVAMREGLLPRR